MGTLKRPSSSSVSRAASARSGSKVSSKSPKNAMKPVSFLKFVKGKPAIADKAAIAAKARGSSPKEKKQTQRKKQARRRTPEEEAIWICQQLTHGKLKPKNLRRTTGDAGYVLLRHEAKKWVTLSSVQELAYALKPPEEEWYRFLFAHVCSFMMDGILQVNRMYRILFSDEKDIYYFSCGVEHGHFIRDGANQFFQFLKAYEVTDFKAAIEDKSSDMKLLENLLVKFAKLPEQTLADMEKSMRHAWEACAVQSGTAALYGAMKALGVSEPTHHVLVPAFTCAACADAIVHAGGRPIPIDCDLESYGVSLEAVQTGLADKNVVGIVIAPCYGVPARDFAAIQALCKERGLWLCEDACESYGASCNVRGFKVPVGSLATLSVVSVRSEKMIGVGEGGAILGNDATLVARAKWWCSRAPCRGVGLWRVYEHDAVGQNFRMPEMPGATRGGATRGGGWLAG
ncbi:unnamed protein product [Durusdinium trenchii]|uniref:Uncharacterized protein n=1 Tax=Durusdinium trenchii TaxID=1381693 RepID=A0ABP0PN30_9DINO